jgi:hypothetical protein
LQEEEEEEDTTLMLQSLPSARKNLKEYAILV